MFLQPLNAPYDASTPAARESVLAGWALFGEHMAEAIHARVLIVARDDIHAGPLSDGLDRLGWRTVTARGEKTALIALSDLHPDTVILDLASLGEDAAPIARRLKAQVAPRRLPVIAMGAPAPGDTEDAFDLMLAAPLNPIQATMRLETLVRNAIAEEELELRTETFAEFAREVIPAQPETGPYTVLAIGEPAPQFLALSNALAERGASVVGAFTAFTAFDYLHERTFDAVVLWAGDSPQEALSIAAGLRRNTRLYHTPALLYMRPDSPVTPAEAYHRGVSDVATAQTAESETAARVVELARAHRAQKAVRLALEQTVGHGLIDAPTGLFNRELFAKHVERLATAARQRNRPLSVCVLTVADRIDLKAARKGGWVARALPQIGSMVGRLVRIEDTAARMGPETFAVAFPGTGLEAARAAGERIAAVIGCTAFEAGSGNSPFVIEFDMGVAEVSSPEDAAEALESAAQMATQRKAS
jgi:two-component system cell cycle response regulator PopA